MQRQGFDCIKTLNRCGDNADHATFFNAFDSKQNRAFNLGKQSVILAHANIVTGVKLSTALPHDNAAR
jgi:hypothetical protein